jgi:drug/metabolite transporter (DMT)-like permease
MIFVIVLYFLFASTFTLGKAALSYVSPLLFIGMRMTLAGSMLLGYSWIKNKKTFFIKYSDYSLFFCIIIFHIFCSYTLEYWALAHVTSAKACLLYNLSPFITALFSYFLFQERLSMKQIAGLGVGFLGFLPILMAQAPTEQLTKNIGFLSLYEIALILSVASSAYGWMIMKKLINKGYSFILINGIGMTGGGLLAFFTSLIIEGKPAIKTAVITMPLIANTFGIYAESVLMLLLYGLSLIFIANIICYNLYGHLLSRYSATFLSFAGFMTPLFAALLGWLFLGEKVTWHFFATILLVLYGLYLFHEKKEITFEEKGL